MVSKLVMINVLSTNEPPIEPSQILWLTQQKELNKIKLRRVMPCLEKSAQVATDEPAASPGRSSALAPLSNRPGTKLATVFSRRVESRRRPVRHGLPCARSRRSRVVGARARIRRRTGQAHWRRCRHLFRRARPRGADGRGLGRTGPPGRSREADRGLLRTASEVRSRSASLDVELRVRRDERRGLRLLLELQRSSRRLISRPAGSSRVRRRLRATWPRRRRRSDPRAPFR